ncbi:MAG TPA: M50 family metallopeptidase [Candidatus Angelobacter sp.]|jgi:hypothetical protein
MTHSATPLLDLEAPVPVPNVALTLKGLFKAVPAAIGLIALIPLTIYLSFVVGVHIPQWLEELLAPFLQAINDLFGRGILFAIPTLIAIMFLVTLLHEAGHAIAAVILGWPILEFRVLPFSFKKESHWGLDLSWRFSPGGLVVAEPMPFIRFHDKVKFFALAGPAASFITCAVALFLLFELPGGLPVTVTLLFGLWSLFICIVNVWPVHVRGHELDGYSAFVVARRPHLLAARIASVRLRNQILNGKPLTSANRRWVALAENPGSVTRQSRGGLWLAYVYWLQHGQLDRAADLLEKMLRACNNDDLNFRAVIFAECAVFASLRKNRSAALAWKARTENLYVPEHLRRRLNAFVAWSEGNVSEALREAHLAKNAVQNLDEKSRISHISSWNVWIEELKNAQRKQANSSETILIDDLGGAT